MSIASTRKSDPRRGAISSLGLAWLLLVAALAGLATYVALADRQTAAVRQPAASLFLEAEPAIASAPREEPAAESIEDAPPEDAPPERPAEPPVSLPAAPVPDESQPAAAPDSTRGAEGADPPPWQRYAGAYDAADERPRIAVVLTGLGLSAITTESAILELPAAVSLSFTPYAGSLDHWLALARVNGHEVMLDLPMEPTSYPDDDPGPWTLLTHLEPAENRRRLRWILDRAEGYVGLAAVKGSRFVTSEPQLEPILREIRDRGLLFVDNRPGEDSVADRVARKLGMPHAVNERALDQGVASHVAIDARLAQTERLALANGAAVAMGQPLPATIERLREWVRGLEARGFVLVPVSAIAEASL